VAEPISFNPATVNQTTTGNWVLGQVLEYNGNLYRFVRNYTDAALADGVVVGRQSATSWVVTGVSRTSALGGATTAGGVVCGVAIGAISTSNYGFILVSGLHTNVLGVATVTVAYRQRGSATADSGVNASVATDPTFGTALTAISGGRYTVQVDCL